MNTSKQNLSPSVGLLSNLKATISLSYPIVIAQIGIVAMGVTDTLMVGSLGEAPLAASGIANAIFFFVSVLGIGILSIVPPLVASAKSRRDFERCSSLLSSSLQVATGVALLSMLVVLLMSFQFAWFKQTQEVEIFAVPYLQILAVSVIPLLLFLAAKSYTDGLSITKPAMYVNFICFFLNIAFNWVLIYGKLGFPALGLNGAGIATLLSRVLMAMGVILFIVYSGKIKRTLPSFLLWSISWVDIKKIFKLGFPAGMQYVFEVSAFAGASVMIGWLGTSQLAAHQIAINLASITYMIAMGFSAAASIRVGNALGERQFTQIRSNGSAAFLLTGAFMTLSCFLFINFSNEFVHLYIKEGEVVEIAASLLVIAGFFQLSDGLQCVALGALRGLEDVNIPTIFTLIAYWAVGLPVGYVLAFYAGLGVQGVWLGLSAGLMVSAFLLTYRFYHLVAKRHHKKEVFSQNLVEVPTKLRTPEY